jgi:hypothetical protein
MPGKLTPQPRPEVGISLVGRKAGLFNRSVVGPG